MCQENSALQFHRDRCFCTWELSRTSLYLSIYHLSPIILHVLHPTRIGAVRPLPFGSLDTSKDGANYSGCSRVLSSWTNSRSHQPTPPYHTLHLATHLYIFNVLYNKLVNISISLSSMSHYSRLWNWEGVGGNCNLFFIFLNFIYFNKNCIYLRHRTWFDIHMHSEMIAKVKLINLSPQIVILFFVKRTLEISCSIQYSIIKCSHHAILKISRLTHPV